MKRVQQITAEEENFRCEPIAGMLHIHKIRRDPVKSVPVGTIVLEIFRVVGYDSDCDGGLMARMENINLDGDATGWQVESIGLYPESTLITSIEELHALLRN